MGLYLAIATFVGLIGSLITIGGFLAGLVLWLKRK